MPPGWTQQWDQNSQRWFYIEQATGRTQWDPPAHLPPGPYAPPAAGAPYMPQQGHDERGLFGNTHGHQGHDYTQSGAATNEAEKKKSGHSTAMLAAAGVGGIAAGAFIGHQLGMCFYSPNLPASKLTSDSRRQRRRETAVLRSSARSSCCRWLWRRSVRPARLRRSPSTRSVWRPGVPRASSSSHPR
jgi:hypothetical protein